MSSADTVVVQVVDDHPATAEGLEHLLAGPDVRFVPHVASVESVDPAVQVVICDLVLPGANRAGYDAITYLVEEVGVRVVATSGVARPALVADSVAAGASAFVTKDGPFPSALWRYALAAAAGSGRFVTSRLAEALLQDKWLRPLPSKEEFRIEAMGFLRAVVQDADSEITKDRRDWNDPEVRALTSNIWRVTRYRANHHRVGISDLLRQAAPLLRQGMRQTDVARELHVAPDTLRDHLNQLRLRYEIKHSGDETNRFTSMRQTHLLLNLLDLEDNTAAGAPDY